MFWTILAFLCIALIPATAKATESTFLDDDTSPLTQLKGRVALSDAHSLPFSKRSTIAHSNQLNPFSTVVSITFDNEETVGDAVKRLAQYIGYSLFVGGFGVDRQAALIFTKPLPEVHRNFTHTNIESILVALIGQRRTLVVDHKLRALSADYSPGQRRWMWAGQ